MNGSCAGIFHARAANPTARSSHMAKSRQQTKVSARVGMLVQRTALAATMARATDLGNAYR